MRCTATLLLALIVLAVLLHVPLVVNATNQCRLAGVRVNRCDLDARWEAVLLGIPSEHRRLVKRIEFEPDRAADYGDGVLHLPTKYTAWTAGALRHEVGHAVFARHYPRPKSLQQQWIARFWTHDVNWTWRPTAEPGWEGDGSAYWRSGPAEDAAQAYQGMIEGTLAACCPQRHAWMLEHLPAFRSR